jgi:predicted SprT family Zn-dependent metalloprotease
MDTSEARTVAIELMRKHGLVDKHWRFQFDESVRRFGLCSYQTSTISLSRTLTELNTIDVVQDTILHEIAHALAGPTAKHGRVWQLMAQSIGAKPERCYSSDEVQTPTAPWQAICQFCHRVIKRHRIRFDQTKTWCNCSVSMAQNPRVYLKWERTKQ